MSAQVVPPGRIPPHVWFEATKAVRKSPQTRTVLIEPRSYSGDVHVPVRTPPVWEHRSASWLLYVACSVLECVPVVKSQDQVFLSS